MALKVHRNFKFKGIRWISGHMYKFHYRGYGTDPEPIVILLYKFSGTHPTTGRQWRFIQCINIAYLPRHIRHNFVMNWKIEMERSGGNTYLTWERLKRQYPMVAREDVCRRYFYSPNYYIMDPVYIPPDQWEKTAMISWWKDYSKKLRQNLVRRQKATSKRKTDRGGVVSRILGSIFGRRK